MKIKRKAQVWGLDVMVATSIFIFGISLFFLYSINYPKGEQEKIEDLLLEGNKIAEDLMSEGSPSDWTIETVSKIGVLSENKINQTKLEQFYQLVSDNYGNTKFLFNTKYNYFVNASIPLKISIFSIHGIGNEPLEATNLIKVTRITIYENKPINFEVQVWE